MNYYVMDVYVCVYVMDVYVCVYVCVRYVCKGRNVHCSYGCDLIVVRFRGEWCVDWHKLVWNRKYVELYEGWCRMDRCGVGI